MKTASKDHVGRRCALCGLGQSQGKGGLAGFASYIELLKEQDVKFKLPLSKYLHIRCANKLQDRP